MPPSPGDGSEPVQLSSGELCPLSPAGGSHFPVALGGLQAGTASWAEHCSSNKVW